jgi:hypothetical protein
VGVYPKSEIKKTLQANDLKRKNQYTVIGQVFAVTLSARAETFGRGSVDSLCYCQ